MTENEKLFKMFADAHTVEFSDDNSLFCNDTDCYECVLHDNKKFFCKVCNWDKDIIKEVLVSFPEYKI